MTNTMGEVEAQTMPGSNGSVDETDISELRDRLLHLTLTLSVTEVAAFVTHELSQPMGAMQLHATACARWLVQTPPNLEEAKDAAQRTLRDGDRVRKSIQALRALMPACEADMTLQDPNQLVRDALRLLSETERAQQFEIRSDLGAVPLVLADPLQIAHVLMHMLRNAVEAMADSPPPRIVTVSSRHDLAEGVVFTVSDRGIGIELDPEDPNSFFTPLLTTKPGGLGLGLATSRRVVEVHGGRIWAESNDDGGATFAFSLPAHVT